MSRRRRAGRGSGVAGLTGLAFFVRRHLCASPSNNVCSAAPTLPSALSAYLFPSLPHSAVNSGACGEHLCCIWWYSLCSAPASAAAGGGRRRAEIDALCRRTPFYSAAGAGHDLRIRRAATPPSIKQAVGGSDQWAAAQAPEGNMCLSSPFMLPIATFSTCLLHAAAAWRALPHAARRNDAAAWRASRRYIFLEGDGGAGVAVAWRVRGVATAATKRTILPWRAYLAKCGGIAMALLLAPCYCRRKETSLGYTLCRFLNERLRVALALHWYLYRHIYSSLVCYL